MDVSFSRAQSAFLRTQTVAGATRDKAPETGGLPKDTVVLGQQPKLPTRTFVDADGNVIRRYGDPDRLGRLADQCKPGKGPDGCQVIHKQPTPNGEHGYVVMAGKDIPSDHLTIPLAPITGTEDPKLLEPGAENYFADAWKDGRGKAAESFGTTAEQLPRNAIALAVNSQGGRSQDRLHIHADRLDPKLDQQLKLQLDQGQISSNHFSDLKPVYGHQYRAMWVEGTDLKQNPLQLVHDQLVAEHGGGEAGEKYARTHMGQHSLAVVGQTDSHGRPGFIVIDGHYGGPENSGSAEEWLMGHANAAP